MISIVRVLTDGWTDGNGPNIIFEKDSFTEIFEWMRFVGLAAIRLNKLISSQGKVGVESNHKRDPAPKST